MRRTISLHVQDRRVYCPVRGELDIEQCVGCERFKDIVATRDGYLVVCERPPARLMAVQPQG